MKMCHTGEKKNLKCSFSRIWFMWLLSGDFETNDKIEQN